MGTGKVKVAEKDIVEVNENGQSVVVVPAGQQIPEGVKVPATPTPESETKRTPAKRSGKSKS